MIVSKEVMARVRPFVSADLFKLKYGNVIARWCIDFYDEHADAPQRHIEDIYERERENLPEAISALTATFLADLSNRYENIGHLNVNYVSEQAREYARRRGLEQFYDEGITALRSGRVQEAEQALTVFRNNYASAGRSYNPIKIDQIAEQFSADRADELFSMAGAVGSMIGPFKRSWLVAYLGPMKRGKTFWLWETCINSVVHRYRTLFVSLEMNKPDTNRRLFKRMLNRPDEEADVVVPVFDCFHNQDNTCRLSQRVARNQKVVDEEGNLLKYKPSIRYKACTACKGNSDEYYPAVWAKTIRQKKFGSAALKKKINSFTTMYGDNLRVCIFPAFSAAVKDIEDELNWLELVEDFKVDTLVVDYADIVNPGRANLSERGSLDFIWKRLKQLAAERNILVVTASQTNRQAILRDSIRDVDTAEDIRKMAHVDLTMGLNQTAEEKEVGLLRVNGINHRHKRIAYGAEAWVLQALDIGLPLIDSFLHIP